VVGLVFFLSGFFNSEDSSQEQGDQSYDIVNLWNEQKFSEVLKLSKEQLTIHPLDPLALFFNGIANYYIGIGKINIEEQLTYINQAIFNLSKSLFTLPEHLQPKARYVLGKAYFQKGKFYSDLAIKHLIYSMEKGYNADDLIETIGLAYFNAGVMDQSLTYLLEVEKQKSTPLLDFKIGEIYGTLNQSDKAIEYLQKAVETSNDFSLIEKAFMAMGDIYFSREDWEQAEKSYLEVIGLNPGNIEGHFQLGEVYFYMGNKIKARAQWVKTFRLDNNHYNARLRLYG